MFSVIPDAVLDELNTIFDDVSTLSPDELTVLSFCLIEGSISNQRLQYVLNMHSADITHLLKKLCIENYLESDNNGRWTTYKIVQKVATSAQKVATSTQKVATSEINLEEHKGKNMKREDIERIILLLCKDNYLKKEEIAHFLGKSEGYIRNKILPNLLASGKLVKRFPFTHNHPEQGYKAVEI